MESSEERDACYSQSKVEERRYLVRRHQKRTFSGVEMTQICVDVCRYLVDVNWMKLWKKYTGYAKNDQSSAGQRSYFPGPVETSSLFSTGTGIKEMANQLK